jgi:hypothetical protein
MGESPGAVEARAPVGARPESAMRRPGGASTGGMDSERAVVSGRASAADVVSRIIIHCVCVCEFKTGPHSTAALMQARPRGGAYMTTGGIGVFSIQEKGIFDTRYHVHLQPCYSSQLVHSQMLQIGNFGAGDDEDCKDCLDRKSPAFQRLGCEALPANSLPRAACQSGLPSGCHVCHT